MVFLKEHDLSYLNGGGLEIPTEIGNKRGESTLLDQTIKTWGEDGIRAATYLKHIRGESNDGNFTIILIGDLERDKTCHCLIELLRQGGPFSLIMVSPQKPNEMTDFQKCLWKLQLPVNVFAADNLSAAIQWETKRKESVLRHIEEAKERKHRLFHEHLKNPEEEEEFRPPPIPVFFYFAEIPSECPDQGRFDLTAELVSQASVGERPVIVLNERNSRSISP